MTRPMLSDADVNSFGGYEQEFEEWQNNVCDVVANTDLGMTIF